MEYSLEGTRGSYRVLYTVYDVLRHIFVLVGMLLNPLIVVPIFLFGLGLGTVLSLWSLQWYDVVAQGIDWLMVVLAVVFVVVLGVGVFKVVVPLVTVGVDWRKAVTKQINSAIANLHNLRTLIEDDTTSWKDIVHMYRSISGSVKSIIREIELARMAALLEEGCRDEVLQFFGQAMKDQEK